MDCYEFAGTIPRPDSEDRPPQYVPPYERLQYHSYWRTDLAPFAERQEWMLKSFFATQDVGTSRLVLWSNGDLSGNEILQKYLRTYPESFVLQVADFQELSRGTALEGSELLEFHDQKAWVDGDLLRLLVLWNYGGVWVDMDSLLTRDIRPLVEHEFVTQWDCYGAQAGLWLPHPGLLAKLIRATRQALRPVQRRPHALPPTLALSLRSFLHHVNLASAARRVYRLGRNALPEALAAPYLHVNSTFQYPSVLLLGCTVVSTR